MSAALRLAQTASARPARPNARLWLRIPLDQGWLPVPLRLPGAQPYLIREDQLDAQATWMGEAHYDVKVESTGNEPFQAPIRSGIR
jgi:hypothetical protein